MSKAVTGRGEQAVAGRGSGTLASRITVLAVGIAILTALLAGALTVGLTRSVVDASARTTLAALADSAADRADAGLTIRAQSRAVRALGLLGVQAASVGRSGRVTATSPLARAALTPQRQEDLLAGRSISAGADVAGYSLLVEGRPTDSGGVLLVQRRSDATAGSDRLVRRVMLALLIAALAAVVVSSVVAHRMSRPLRRTASAAHALAAGDRDLVVPVAGPAEVAQVATALNSLSSSLSRSEGRQRDFLLSVSHDLRTPLTGIKGYAESLAQGVIPPDQAARAGEVMLAEAGRLERLVADLLDLARLDADQQRVSLSRVELVPLGRSVEAVWSARCAAAGVGFDLVLGAGQVWATTDPERVRQIVDGLLENALRVTPASRPIVVEIRPTPGGGAVVEVRDGGPGLTDDDLAVAFEPSALYERYRGLRPVGTGLGLAIAGRLARLLGGRLEAGHALEGGARFTLTLPAG